MKIHFLMAANNSSSQTRVTVEYANALVRQRHEMTVSVPRFDFLDYVLWRLRREGPFWRRPLWTLRQWLSWWAIPLAKAVISRRPWFGQTGHTLDPRVRVNRFLLLPARRNLPDADFLIAFQCYLLGRLVRLPAEKGKVVGSIRLDYAAGMKDSDPTVAQWRGYCNSFYQRLSVPLFAVSRRSAESARSMGIPVRAVIQNGINTEEFRDGGRRGAREPLRVTLFTNEHPQKGQEVGAEAVRRLRVICAGRQVRFGAVRGRLHEEYRGLFDDNHGYLTGQRYVRVFQESDIFIYPSRYEGFPAVPLEAMACGCALATTRVSGVEEYAMHEKNCMVSEPGDAEGIVRNVQRLIEDARLRDELRGNGILTARRYSWEAAAERLVEFLSGSEKRDPAWRREEVVPFVAAAR